MTKSCLFFKGKKAEKEDFLLCSPTSFHLSLLVFWFARSSFEGPFQEDTFHFYKKNFAHYDAAFKRRAIMSSPPPTPSPPPKKPRNESSFHHLKSLENLFRTYFILFDDTFCWTVSSAYMFGLSKKTLESLSGETANIFPIQP